MKIGIYGGTFNPIHLGHLAVAEAAKETCCLDEVWFIPAGDPYMKNRTELASGQTRYNMIDQTIKDFNIEWAKVYPIEILRDGPSYTIDTMNELSGQFPNHEFYLIMGFDAYKTLPSWKEGDRLAALYNLIVFNRDHEDMRTYFEEHLPESKVITYLPDFNNNISSSHIRYLAKTGGSFQSMVAPSVYKTIQRTRLYILNEYDRYMQNFSAPAHKAKVVEWIRNKMNGFSKNSTAVIGISGGKDSSVVAALCVEALGADRVYGVMMPNGEQTDIGDSKKLIMNLGIRSLTINIKKAYDALVTQQLESYGHLSSDAKINLPARLRMSALYMVAQSIGNAFVINTCNLSEDWVGYSTWHGDSAGDFSPLANFTSDEVVAIGDACGLPYDLTHKAPSDGLCGETDEEKLGFSYRELNAYIRCGIEPNIEIKNKIDRLHKANAFKLQPLDSYKWEP